MALRTRPDYLDSIGQLDTTLCAFGSRVSDLYGHPCAKPAMDAIGLVYDLAADPGNEELFTAPSPFIGGRVNRFLHIHQSQEDLQGRFRLARFMVRKHGACIDARCGGTSALNSLKACTYDIDQDLGWRERRLSANQSPTPHAS
jgi:4-hydroxybutyryl-CoA dehydratase/vinylacetyl-CoA-Delta-isomerase